MLSAKSSRTASVQCLLSLFALLQPSWLTGRKTPTYLPTSVVSRPAIAKCGKYWDNFSWTSAGVLPETWKDCKYSSVSVKQCKNCGVYTAVQVQGGLTQLCHRAWTSAFSEPWNEWSCVTECVCTVALFYCTVSLPSSSFFCGCWLNLYKGVTGVDLIS